MAPATAPTYQRLSRGSAAFQHVQAAGTTTASVSVQDVNPPESPRITYATIVGDSESGHEGLLARDERGRELAFVFEATSDAPGLSLVDPRRLQEAADAPDDSEERFDAVIEPRADDWLPSVVAHPVGAEWLRNVQARHPAAYHAWFAQTQYETGGEEGSG